MFLNVSVAMQMQEWDTYQVFRKDQMRNDIRKVADKRGLDLGPDEIWEYVYMTAGKAGRFYAAPEHKATHIRVTLEQEAV